MLTSSSKVLPKCLFLCTFLQQKSELRNMAQLIEHVTLRRNTGGEFYLSHASIHSFLSAMRLNLNFVFPLVCNSVVFLCFRGGDCELGGPGAGGLHFDTTGGAALAL